MGGSCDQLEDWADDRKIGCDLHEHQMTFGTCSQDYGQYRDEGQKSHLESKAFIEEQLSNMKKAGQRVMANDVEARYDSQLIIYQIQAKNQSHGKFDTAKCFNCIDSCLSKLSTAHRYNKIMIRLIKACTQWGGWRYEKKIAGLEGEQEKISQMHKDCSGHLTNTKAIQAQLERLRNHLKSVTKQN